MNRVVYLDNAATTPVDPAVMAQMLPYFSERFGNPMTHGRSSLGDQGRDAVEKARAEVAALIGARADQIAFTSGGTESDNWAVKGAMEQAAANGARGEPHLVASGFEHMAVLKSAEAMARHGYEYTLVKVDASGIVDPDDVVKALRPNTALVSIMHANNEIGTIQPIADITRRAHGRGILVHADAVQTAGHIPVDVAALGVDFLSLSAHKFNGPKGVGALYIKDKRSILPLLDGGGQEGGLRGSTHNVPGIVGLGAAAALARSRLPGEQKRLEALRDALLERLRSRIGNISVNGELRRRLPHNLSLRIAGLSSEALLRAMNEAGIIAAGCSACNAESAGPSHVLSAIGCSPEEALCSIRLSLGYATSSDDIDYAADVIPDLVRLLRTLSR